MRLRRVIQELLRISVAVRVVDFQTAHRYQQNNQQVNQLVDQLLGEKTIATVVAAMELIINDPD